MRDHDGVVSAQKSRWQQKRLAHFLGKDMHRGSNLRIGGHAASDDDPGDPFLPLAVKRLLHLEAQRLSHSQHIGCADITQCGRGRVGTGFADTPALLHEHGMFVEIRQRGRLQSAEAEIQIIHMGVRTREQMGIGSPPLGEPIQQHPAGIWQPQHLRKLVAGFPGSVIKRMPEQFQGLWSVYPVNMGMPAGNKQSEQRIQQLMLKADGQQMRMEMVDGNKRFVARQRKPFCKGHADKQGPKETGTAGHRYDVHVRESQSRAAHQLVIQCAQKTVVLTRRDLRDDPPEQGVHIHLRGEHGFHTLPVSDQRQRRFITRCFDTKTKHDNPSCSI